MRKLFLSLLTLVCALVSWAIVEEREIMTVIKSDGTTVVYDVNDVEKVTFEVKTEEYKMVISPSQGEAVKLETVPTVFRVTPSKEGEPYLFGFTTVEAENAAAARQGKYAVELSVSALKMNTASVDLKDGSASGVNVTLYTYADGEVAEVKEVQTSGTLTTAVNTKNKQVTVNLEAAYKDGTTLNIEYVGAVKDVESLEGFNPPYVYNNEGQYFNADGLPGGIFKVEGMTYTPDVNYRGVSGDRFDFTLGNGKTCWFILAQKYIDKVFDFATAEGGECYFWYDNIQIVSKGTPYMNQGTDGTISVKMNEDRTFTVDFKVSNQYISSYGTAGGTPEYVVLNYTSTDPIPEPEPQPEPIENLENQLQHFNAEGEPEWPLTISKVEYSTEKSIPYNSVKCDRFDIVFAQENTPTFYFMVDPSLVGTTIDLATVSKPYYIKYGAVELASPGLSWLSEMVGKEGTIKFTKQEDGSYIIDLDIKFKRSGNPDSKEYIKANCKTGSIAVDPEPEPITVDPNTCLYVQASGTERTFTVENCDAQTSKSYNGLTFDAYSMTLSGDMLCTVYIAADRYNNKIDFANAPDDSYFVTFGFSYSNLIQLGAKNTKRPGSYNEGLKGSLLVTKNENGTVVIDLDVTNTFNSAYGYDNGDGSHVVLNYTEPQPEPEPEPAYKNQGQHFTADGVAENIFDVTDMKVTENTRVNGVSGFNKYELTLSNGTECYVAIKPEYIGKTIDFETADKDCFLMKYGYNMNYGSKDNSMFAPQGINGKISVVKNEDGSYTIDMDVYAHYINYGQTNNTSKERVVLNYTSPAPEPEGFKNQGQHYTADGAEEAVFDVTALKVTENTRVNGVSGFNKYELTLSNGMDCYVAIKPEYIGKTIDFENADKDSFLMKYGYNMNYGSKDNTMFAPQGINGTISVVKKDDGTYVIDMDVYAHYINYGQTNNTSKERIVLNYTGK